MKEGKRTSDNTTFIWQQHVPMQVTVGGSGKPSEASWNCLAACIITSGNAVSSDSFLNRSVQMHREHRAFSGENAFIAYAGKLECNCKFTVLHGQLKKAQCKRISVFHKCEPMPGENLKAVLNRSCQFCLMQAAGKLHVIKMVTFPLYPCISPQLRHYYGGNQMQLGWGKPRI